MAKPDKPGSQPPLPRPPVRPVATAPGATRAERRPSDPAIAAAKEALFATAKEVVLERRPYLRFAFSNPYNVSLFLGGLAASMLTLNPLLLVATLGLEGLWLLWAPDSKRLRHLLWDPKFEKLRILLEERARSERLEYLAPPERDRVDSLVETQRQIRRLAAQNPSFTGDLLRGELVKTDRLVDAFIEMAVTSARYEAYLGSVDLDDLDRERARLEREVRSGPEGDPQVDLSRKNLAIILRRLDKMKEIQHYLTVARGQLDLIENSFQLIADQIVTMQSPQELSGQLNELLDGVESIHQTAIETDRILSALGTGA